MKYSSQKLGKMLKQIEEELRSLLLQEESAKEFCATIGEDVESVRPDYDFIKTQQLKEQLNAKIRKIKHALNEFNVSTVVQEFDMTVDQMLVYIPQLYTQKNFLAGLKDKLPKSRVVDRMRTLNMVDYCYLNYSVADATAKYNEVSAALSEAQMALDKLNALEVIEIDL